MQITLQDEVIYFHVETSKRKKMDIEMTQEGIITVKAPNNTSEQQILEFMKLHEKPLLQIHHRLKNRTMISSRKTYTEDEIFLYLGKAYRLTDLVTNPEFCEITGIAPIDLSSDIHEDEMQLPDLHLICKRFYTRQTKAIVKKRVKHYEKIIGVKSKSMTVVESQGTWGTCNSLRELTFNYRLSMAPLSVIDYVVIHELCHLLHLNHDRSFWRKVGTYDPSYKDKEDYLAKYGRYMTI